MNMTGNEIYEMKIVRKTQDFINNSNHKGLLQSYASFIQSNSLTSRYEYVVKVENFLNHVDKDISNINVNDIIDYLSYKEFKEDGSRYTSSYRISIYTALLHLFEYAKVAAMIERNPMEGIKRPKRSESQKTIEKREKGYLTKREIRKTLETVQEGVGGSKARAHQKKVQKRDLLIFMLFLTTGIRCSALTKLDVNSIDTEKKTLYVTEKGDKVKSIDLGDDVITVLLDWLAQREQYVTEEENGLFVSANGDRLSNAGVNKIIKKFTSEITGKNITPHKLRATYGTQLYNSTHDIYFVQQCMGHSSPSTTELYVRGNNGNTKRASELMSQLIK